MIPCTEAINVSTYEGQGLRQPSLAPEQPGRGADGMIVTITAGIACWFGHVHPISVRADAERRVSELDLAE